MQVTYKYESDKTILPHEQRCYPQRILPKKQQTNEADPTAESPPDQSKGGCEDLVLTESSEYGLEMDWGD